jgi:hypothetical protein
MATIGQDIYRLSVDGTKFFLMTIEPRGCLAFLFGFAGSGAASGIGADPSAGEEGNYHSGPGGYEGGGYAGGYAADYRAEQEYFDEGHEGEA